MNAREEILGRVRRAGHEVTIGDGMPMPVTLPGPTPYEARAARFTARALAASATVVRAVTVNDVADAVADYLAAANLPPVVHLTAAPPGLGPGAAGRLRCEAGPPRPDGDTVVSGCFAAVAEEGVIVMVSGAEHTPETHMLAATHIAIVAAGQLLDSLEALWLRLGALREFPRHAQLVLGPSRTADLGLPIQLGVHGPLRVHVVLIDEPAQDVT